MTGSVEQGSLPGRSGICAWPVLLCVFVPSVMLIGLLSLAPHSVSIILYSRTPLCSSAHCSFCTLPHTWACLHCPSWYQYLVTSLCPDGTLPIRWDLEARLQILLSNFFCTFLSGASQSQSTFSIRAQLNNRGTTQFFKKCTKDLNRHFCKEDIVMTNKDLPYWSSGWDSMLPIQWSGFNSW